MAQTRARSRPKAPIDLEGLGFIQVNCNACDNKDVWLRCDQCEKSDRFKKEESQVTCHCSATYTHAVCLCGERCPLPQLTLVPFEKGPVGLADMEWAWDRMAVLGAVTLILLGTGGALYWVF